MADTSAKFVGTITIIVKLRSETAISHDVNSNIVLENSDRLFQFRNGICYLYVTFRSFG